MFEPTFYFNTGFNLFIFCHEGNLKAPIISSFFFAKRICIFLKYSLFNLLGVVLSRIIGLPFTQYLPNVKFEWILIISNYLHPTMRTLLWFNYKFLLVVSSCCRRMKVSCWRKPQYKKKRKSSDNVTRGGPPPCVS